MDLSTAVSVAVVCRGIIWQVESLAVKRVVAMADSWVDWMVDKMVDRWAVGLGYTAVAQ